ncbi:Dehydrogenase/reductase SDR member 1 [Clonorchis sinensis]|uniref:Dehydrogenase/reductase SDR member 1 n=1 Tax=Clonorchis sinensis TaxID=79923 RepID=A0A3R7JVM3_CLOSI|nr:Dehydrogenase/reductase SDR member 1 [Clonorchis sinensis]
MPRSENLVCLVTGATRGIGKGIAVGLSERGAIVYITGRTLKQKEKGVRGSLEETAAEIESKGGKAIPVVVDHSDEKQITELFDRIQREQDGRLDVLVNNVFSAIPFLKESSGKTYYQIDSRSPGEAWDEVNNVGLRNHYICATLATRVMIEHQKREPTARPGLIVNVSSFGGSCYLFNPLYGCGKEALDRLTRDMDIELKRNKVNICIISLWPGVVRTEELAQMASDKSDPLFAAYDDSSLSESTELVGLAVAALAREDPSTLMARSGDIVLVSDVVAQHDLREPDGSVPTNYRSLKVLLRLSKYRLAGLIPGFIRIPKPLFAWFITMR